MCVCILRSTPVNPSLLVYLGAKLILYPLLFHPPLLSSNLLMASRGIAVWLSVCLSFCLSVWWLLALFLSALWNGCRDPLSSPVKTQLTYNCQQHWGPLMYERDHSTAGNRVVFSDKHTTGYGLQFMLGKLLNLDKNMIDNIFEICFLDCLFSCYFMFCLFIGHLIV